MSAVALGGGASLFTPTALPARYPAWLPVLLQALVGVVLGLGVVAGMFLEADLIVVASAGAAMMLALVWPTAALVTLGFLAPLKTPLAIPAPGLNTILVALLILGGMVRVSVDRGRLRITAPLALALGFSLYVFVQQFPDMLDGYQTARAHDVGYLFFQLATGLGAIVAVALVQRGRSPYPLFAALLLGALVAAIIAIVTADGLPSSRFANLMPASDIDERATGPFGNPNAFGQLVAYAVILAVGLIMVCRSRAARFGLLLVAVPLIYALAISLSRGATVALLVGSISLAFTRGRRVGMVAIIVAIVLALVVYPAFVDWRLTTLEGGPTAQAYAELASSDGSRFEAVSAAPAILAMDPLFGVGFGNYRYFSPLVTDGNIALVAHNWYGTVLAEQGLLGLALWFLMLLTLFKRLWRVPRRARDVALPMLIALAVGCFFLQPPTAFQISFLPAAVIISSVVADWGGQNVRSIVAADRQPPFGPARLTLPLGGWPTSRSVNPRRRVPPCTAREDQAPGTIGTS